VHFKENGKFERLWKVNDYNLTFAGIKPKAKIVDLDSRRVVVTNYDR
jgi:hypothetical protein